MRAGDIPAADRIRAKLVEQPNGCMYWAGYVDSQGYGRIGYLGRRGVTLQHAVYDCLVGPIPPGMVPDHNCHTQDTTCAGGSTCMHRRCGNPAHLVLRTTAENCLVGRSFAAKNARKTHCAHGHEYTEANTYRSAGRRYCVECYTVRHGHPPVRQVAA